MQSRLRRIRRTFTISIISLSMLSVALLGIALYETSVIRFGGAVSSAQLHELVSDYPEVSKYLIEQKQSEAHFVKIANLVKNDQQRLLGRALLTAAGLVTLISGLLGYLLARKLLRPVQETYERQEVFLQDAAHEMRNPLAAMSAVVQQAVGPKSNPSVQRKALDTLGRQTKHLVKLNEDLLLIEKPRNIGVSKNANISELLEDVIDSLRPQAISKKIKVQLSTSLAPIKWPIASEDFVCVARNIIENAIKYSSSDSKKVEVSIVIIKNVLSLTVKDQGIGIPEDELSYIGQRFFRAKNVARTEGTGLGIALVESIVESHGGTVHISSQKNKGTTVVATFKK